MMTKRDFIRRMVFGAGYLGLRSLATGLPIAFLANPRRALAQGACTGGITGPGPDVGIAQASAANGRAQFLILSTSSGGDPINANVPGTYYDPNSSNLSVRQQFMNPSAGGSYPIHSADPSMMATSFNMGTQAVMGAAVWSPGWKDPVTSAPGLPQWVLDRTCFFHCATGTPVHPNEPKVLALMGDTALGECLPSVYAKTLGPIFNTIQQQPLSVGAGNFLSFQGRSLPNLPPIALAQVLTHPGGELAQLMALRDSSLDEINVLLKQSGTSAQKAYVDSLATARSDARKVSDSLLAQLSCISTNGPAGQVTAAVTLIQMKVAPVMVINIPFGGDNHGDPALTMREVPQHMSAIETIGSMMSQLKMAGIQDQVTFAVLNVFGRTLGSGNNQNQVGATLVGRTHNDAHHVGLMIGRNVAPSVIGGVMPRGTDFQAAPIDVATGSAVLTGASDAGAGTILQRASLASYGKTLGAALGVPQTALDTAITSGQVVPAALVTA